MENKTYSNDINKSKKNTNLNEQPQNQGNKQNLEGKIFNHNNSQFPSVFLKNLRIKKFKQKGKNKEIENILSSNRSFNISENENEDGKTDIFNYESNNRYDDSGGDDNVESDYQAYQTEEGFIENIEEMKITPEELYKKIIDINLDNKINNDELKLFFLIQFQMMKLSYPILILFIQIKTKVICLIII